MEIVFSIFIVTAFLLFIDVKSGACIYMFLSVMLPYLNISQNSIHLSFNVMAGLLLVAFYIDFKIKHSYKISFRLFKPFLFLYIGLLILIPIQSGSPSDVMITSWFVNIFRCFIVSFVIGNIFRYYPQMVKYYHYAILLMMFVSFSYGLFIMIQGDGLNPYQIWMAYLNEVDMKENYYDPTDDRIFGRICSVFESPQAYGIFLSMSFVYLLALKEKINKIVLAILLILLGVNIIGCGVRTALVTTLVCLVFVIIKNLSMRIVVWSAVVLIVGIFTLSQSEWLDQYVNSAVNAKKTEETNGSSLSMRMIQFEGCLSEIANCPLQGKGFGWHGHYRETKGNHPIILAFESLIFMVLCDSGVIGLFLWCMFAFIYHRNVKNSSRIYIDMVLITYFVYTIITGDYGYMRYFSLFYVLIYYGLKNMKNETKSKNNRILSTSVSSNS